MDVLLASHRRRDGAGKARDLAYVQSLATQLLSELSETLNRAHNVTHDKRYWQIVFGHWLQRYTAVAFERYRAVEACLAGGTVGSTTVLDCSSFSLAAQTSLAFIWSCNTDAWNHVFYARVLEFLQFEGIERVRCRVDAEKTSTGAVRVEGTTTRLARRLTSTMASRLLPYFARRDDAVIVNSYLPRRSEVTLQLSLRQCPQLWRTPSAEIATPEPARRRALSLNQGGHVGLEAFVRLELMNVVPTCYLEGYQAVVRQALGLPWPTRPRFIFTSNSFDTDEVFKVWAAEKTEAGVPYITGQHGGNYGAVLGNENCPERVTCDTFISWGWTEAGRPISPAFIFKTINRKPRRYARNGGLLLIETSAPHRVTPWDSCVEFAEYLEHQVDFVARLPSSIAGELTIRLHSDHLSHPWREQKRWRDALGNVRIDVGGTPLWSLIEASRLVVHSYDSTGMLETLALDIPTLCFWDGGLDHLGSGAKVSYELLRASGILCNSAQDAAESVARHWDSLSEWWYSDMVQNARREFCARYARTVRWPVNALKELLLAQTRVGATRTECEATAAEGNARLDPPSRLPGNFR